MSSLVDPLQLILSQAAKLAPTGALEPYEQRVNSNPLAPTLLLIDISGSMADIANGRPKIDILREALNRNLDRNEIAIAFSTSVKILKDLQSIPEPSGGTALHMAIVEASKLQPKHSLVISDGMPDSKNQSLDAADKLSGTISTLFIGDDSDKEAIAFMDQLARLGCGKSSKCDIRKHSVQLRSQIQLLLPSKKA